MTQALSRRALWTQKIADQVANTLRERIVSGALQPGESAGGREALMAEFVTTGPIVDRALDTLAEQGLLTPLIGGGFAVAATPPREGGFELPQGDTWLDVRAVLELRLGLEAVGAAYAAERHDAAQMDDIHAACEGYEQAAQQNSGSAQADFRFHSAIAAASGNPYLSDLLDYLGPLLIPRMRVALPRMAGSDRDENLEASMLEHRGIVDAIAARDPEQARERMRAHLLRSIALIDTANGA